MKDAHIHYMPGPADPPKEFLRKTALAGVDGGTIFSMPPASFRHDPENSQHWRERLEFILEYTADTPGFHPFLWIDPTEADAVEQINTAAAAGIHGFKCICNHFYPATQLDKFRLIAETGLPLHFHSGILYDHYASSEFNRPIAFECLIGVKNLKFALAHVGWPWCDEYIALYGKLNDAQISVLHDLNLRMYADLTPGTPGIYRREVLRKLYCMKHYRVDSFVIWGSDSQVNDYNYKDVLELLERDRRIMDEIVVEYGKTDIYRKATEFNIESFYAFSKTADN
jgi:hypothetical protein